MKEFKPKPPAYLSDIEGGVDHFNQLVELVGERYHPSFDRALGILAKAYATMDIHAAEVVRNPTTATRNGGEKSHPAAHQIELAERTIRSYEAKFFLTPKDLMAAGEDNNAPALRPGDPTVVGAV